ncbi:MAG: hypothetical protein KDG50_02225 [Chromatiales bacterium]|nr:hypothetical protein [Chromatiales bacterium]
MRLITRAVTVAGCGLISIIASGCASPPLPELTSAHPASVNAPAGHIPAATGTLAVVPVSPRAMPGAMDHSGHAGMDHSAHGGMDHTGHHGSQP